ncbi:hypothetical protein [Streptomyces sp. ISL-100]|uniref:hypothetical protein n=1 Tax=Streptomyces sp. ISL-100 TaxID=2819173 RepID=UPI0020354717|nr:hypothetical protein [Streptomyces sp. ISL-100]
MLATLVQVPEVDGTFIEFETQVKEESELETALDSVRAVLAALGIPGADLTTEHYTDAVRARRGDS